MDKDLDGTLTIDMPFDEALERFLGVNTRELEYNLVEGKASPLVKWAGGKRSIIAELAANIPNKFNEYYEPFAGGAALFFYLREGLTKACLSDINFELILTYAVIKKDPAKLIERLKDHAKNHNEVYYYKIRAQQNLQEPVEIVARFLYLNKTCYNGLYRVNKKGEFNVPIGSYVNPDIVQETNIQLCHKALKDVRIEYREFDTIQPRENDFVYCDPPYHPLSQTANFTGYTRLDFTKEDQIRLRDFAVKLHRYGVKVMLSNSNTPFIKDLYKDEPFLIKTVHAPRFINCKPSERSDIEELVIMTYGK